MQDFLGQDGDLTDFELQLISGGQHSLSAAVNPIHPNRLTQSSARNFEIAQDWYQSLSSLLTKINLQF